MPDREALGLRWEDIDCENRVIHINHSLVYYPVGESRTSVQHISKPKTKAGERTIPMLDSVQDAFEMLREEQQENGWNDVEIDGMHGFIFCNRFGNVPNPQSINRAIKRIVSDYNATEEIRAKRSTGKQFYCRTSLRTIFGIPFAQGFANRRPT